MDLFSRAVYSKRMKTRTLLLALCASALTPLPAAIAQTDAGETEANNEPLIFKVKVDGKWGVVDSSGQFLVPAQYRWVDTRSDGTILVQGDDYKAVLFDRAGETVIPANFSYIHDFRGGQFTRARLGKEEVVIDRTGKIVLGPGFQTIAPFDGGRKWVVGDGIHKGLLSLDCEWLLEPVYQEVSNVQDSGLAYARDSRGQVGLVDRDGEWATRPGKRFENIAQLSKDGLIPAKADGKWGLIDSTMNWVIEPVDNRSYGYPGIYTDPTQVVVSIDGKFGVIDRDGKVVIPAVHDNVFGGTGTAFTVKKDGKFGAYDRSGNLIVPFEYDHLSAFNADGTAGARKGNHRLTIDLTGQEVEVDQESSLPKIEKLQFFGSKDWAAGKRDGKWGAVNKAHEWVLEPKYDCVEFCYDTPPPPPAMAVPVRYRPLAKDAVKKPRDQDWCRVDD